MGAAKRLGKPVRPLGGPRDPRHGTRSGFDYWNCPCQKCRAAANEYLKQWRESSEVTVHDRNGYDRGCRCEVCKADRLKESRDRDQARKLYRAAHPPAKIISAGVGGLA